MDLLLVLPGKGLEALLGSLGAQLTAAVSSAVVSALGVLTPAAEALVQDSAVGRANFTTLLRMRSYNFTQSRGELDSLGASGALQYFNVTAVLTLPGATLIATWDSSVSRRALEAAASGACNPVETSLPGASVTFVELRVTPPAALLSAIDVTAAELSAYLSAVLLGGAPSADLARFSTAWSTCFVAGGNASGTTLFWGAVLPSLPAGASSSASPAAAGVAGVSSTVQALPSSTVGGIVGGVLAGMALLAALCCFLRGGGAAKKPQPVPAAAEDAAPAEDAASAEDVELTPEGLYDIAYSDAPQPESAPLPGRQPDRLPVKRSGMQLRIEIVSGR